MDNPPKCKVLVLLSGGIDSSACVEYYVTRGFSVSALFVDYDQPDVDHERAAATAIAKHYRILLREIKISGLSISEGYIPARNAILLSIALLIFGQGSGIVAIGIHAGTPYLDCSPGFKDMMQNIYDLYEQGRIIIDTPFLQWEKMDIWKYAKMQKVPIDITHSSNMADFAQEN